MHICIYKNVLLNGLAIFKESSDGLHEMGRLRLVTWSLKRHQLRLGKANTALDFIHTTRHEEATTT